MPTNDNALPTSIPFGSGGITSANASALQQPAAQKTTLVQADAKQSPKAQAPKPVTQNASTLPTDVGKASSGDPFQDRLQNDYDRLDRARDLTDKHMMALSTAMQRQQLVTVNRAQMLRKALPVLAAFTLIAGALGGEDAALAALGGSLAGLKQGEDQRYQEAYKAYSDKMKALQEGVKSAQEEMKEILTQQGGDLREMSAHADRVAARVNAYQVAKMRADSTASNARLSAESRLQAANIGATTRLRAAQIGADSRVQEAAARAGAGSNLAAYAEAWPKIQDALGKTKAVHDSLDLMNAPIDNSQLSDVARVAFPDKPKDLTDSQWSTVVAMGSRHIAQLANANLAAKGASLDSLKKSPDAFKAEVARIVNIERARGTLKNPEALRADMEASRDADLKTINDSLATPGGTSSPALTADSLATFKASDFRAMTPEQTSAFAAQHSGFTPAGFAYFAAENAAQGRTPYIRKDMMSEVVESANYNAASLLAKGLDPSQGAQGTAQFKARAKALEGALKQGTGIETAVGSFQQVAPLAIASAQRLGLGKMRSLNAARNWMNTATSDPETLQLKQYVNDLASDYATIVDRAPIGNATHEVAQKEAADRIAADMSPAGMKAVTDAVIKAAHASARADAQTQARLGAGMSSPGSSAAPLGATGGEPTQYRAPNGQTYSAEDIAAQAAKTGVTPAEYAQHYGLTGE